MGNNHINKIEIKQFKYFKKEGFNRVNLVKIYIIAISCFITIFSSQLKAVDNYIFLHKSGDPYVDKDTEILKIKLAVMKKKVAAYINETYGNRTFCGFVYGTTIKGNFNDSKGDQYLMNYTICHNTPIRENLMGFAFFNDTELVKIIYTNHYLIKKIPDINQDGKDDIIVSAFINDLGGVMNTSIEVIDVSHYNYQSMYSAYDFTINYDMVCFPTLEYDNETGSLFVKKGPSPIFRIEKYKQPIKKCKILGKPIWSETITKIIIPKKTEKGKVTTSQKIKYYNNFKPFYSLQLIVFKENNRSAIKEMEVILKKEGYEIIEFQNDNISTVKPLTHIAFGRYTSKNKALKELKRLGRKYPKQPLFHQIPQVRYFDGRHWVIR